MFFYPIQFNLNPLLIGGYSEAEREDAKKASGRKQGNSVPWPDGLCSQGDGTSRPSPLNKKKKRGIN